jgi:hypothetical protein
MLFYAPQTEKKNAGTFIIYFFFFYLSSLVVERRGEIQFSVSCLLGGFSD